MNIGGQKEFNVSAMLPKHHRRPFSSRSRALHCLLAYCT